MNTKYFFKRFIAFYLDEILIFVVLLFFVQLLNINTDHFSTLLPLFIFIGFIYFVIFDFIFGRTLGKIILRLSIRGYNRKNKKLFLLQILSRNLIRWVPFDQISIFFYEDKRMWHDIVSKTYVEDEK
jgi:uncharacterized RDD family membrane protein YckC